MWKSARDPVKRRICGGRRPFSFRKFGLQLKNRSNKCVDKTGDNPFLGGMNLTTAGGELLSAAGSSTPPIYGGMGSDRCGGFSKRSSKLSTSESSYPQFSPGYPQVLGKNRVFVEKGVLRIGIKAPAYVAAKKEQSSPKITLRICQMYLNRPSSPNLNNSTINLIGLIQQRGVVSSPSREENHISRCKWRRP